MDVANFTEIVTHPLFSTAIAILAAYLVFILIRKVIAVVIWGAAIFIAITVGAFFLDGLTDQPYLDFFPDQLLTLETVSTVLENADHWVEEGQRVSTAAEAILSHEGEKSLPSLPSEASDAGLSLPGEGVKELR